MLDINRINRLESIVENIKAKKPEQFNTLKDWFNKSEISDPDSKEIESDTRKYKPLVFYVGKCRTVIFDIDDIEYEVEKRGIYLTKEQKDILKDKLLEAFIKYQ